jgi:HEPN domain-containing protein
VLFKAAMFLDAIYLAGYGVECGLKALLIARSPRSRRSTIERRAFRGRAGHDYENLRALLQRQGVTFPLPIARLFRSVSTWTTDLRYEVGRGSSEDAQAFILAAREIIEWLERQS